MKSNERERLKRALNEVYRLIFTVECRQALSKETATCVVARVVEILLDESELKKSYENLLVDLERCEYMNRCEQRVDLEIAGVIGNQSNDHPPEDPRTRAFVEQYGAGSRYVPDDRDDD